MSAPSRLEPNEMSGAEALIAFTDAIKHVNAARYAEVLAVTLLPSDRALIERRIQEAKQRAEDANAKGDEK